MIGFRLIENINKLRIKPTPIATPAKETNGILLARYLKPRRIIKCEDSEKEAFNTVVIDKTTKEACDSLLHAFYPNINK